jgi:copper chaperone CopZ
MIESVNRTQSAVQFAVSGMHCQGCVRSVESALASVEGVESVKVSLFSAESRAGAERRCVA